VKASEIRENYTTAQELADYEAELRRKLWKARFDNHTNQLDDTAEIGKIRRDIARVITIRQEMERQEKQA